MAEAQAGSSLCPPPLPSSQEHLRLCFTVNSEWRVLTTQLLPPCLVTLSFLFSLLLTTADTASQKTLMKTPGSHLCCKQWGHPLRAPQETPGQGCTQVKPALSKLSGSPKARPSEVPVYPPPAPCDSVITHQNLICFREVWAPVQGLLGGGGGGSIFMSIYIPATSTPYLMPSFVLCVQ